MSRTVIHESPQTSQLKSLVGRLWARDVTLWDGSGSTPAEILNRLGWLDSIDWAIERAKDLQLWASEIAESGEFDRVVLLGMGGSSLAPAVFSEVFGVKSGYLELQAFDSTSPDMIAELSGPQTRRTLFVVSSKSGTTVETIDLYHHFFDEITRQSTIKPGNQLVAITDQGTWLHDHAIETGFRKVYINPADIGGRYSALSYFGLVAAALIGVDLVKLLERARITALQFRKEDANQNSALGLGLLLGNAALAGRDKLTLMVSPKLESLGVWIEQLIAESTGKQSKGIVPVTGEPTESLAVAVDERVYVSIRLGNESTPNLPADVKQKFHREHLLLDEYDLAAEMFCWEMATAIAASVLAVNPFDEPNVAEAKLATRRFVSGEEFINIEPGYQSQRLSFYLPKTPAQSLSAKQLLAEYFADIDRQGYLGILAYVPMEQIFRDYLCKLRELFSQTYQTPTTLGFGPRYLHSTGQLHKGGPANAHFMQLVTDTNTEISVPGKSYTFGQLFQAQADGDWSALLQHQRPLLRVRLKGSRREALQELVELFEN